MFIGFTLRDCQTVDVIQALITVSHWVNSRSIITLMTFLLCVVLISTGGRLLRKCIYSMFVLHGKQSIWFRANWFLIARFAISGSLPPAVCFCPWAQPKLLKNLFQIKNSFSRHVISTFCTIKLTTKTTGLSVLLDSVGSKSIEPKRWVLELTYAGLNHCWVNYKLFLGLFEPNSSPF